MSYGSKFLLAVSLLAGCAADPSEVARPAGADTGADTEAGDGCVKIEGSQIGQNLSIDVPDIDGVGTVTVSFTSWTRKVGENEYVGFTLDTDATFGVKAGLEEYWDSAGSWLNPNGTSGSAASGISYVEICSANELPSSDDDCDDESGDCGSPPMTDDVCEDGEGDDCAPPPPPPEDGCDLNGDGDDTDQGECHDPAACGT